MAGDNEEVPIDEDLFAGEEIDENLIFKMMILNLMQLTKPQLINNKYEKHFPKMPKTTQTRYMDGTVQATQRTTQVTPSLHHFSFVLSAQSCFQYSDSKS